MRTTSNAISTTLLRAGRPFWALVSLGLTFTLTTPASAQADSAITETEGDAEGIVESSDTAAGNATEDAQTGDATSDASTGEADASASSDVGVDSAGDSDVVVDSGGGLFESADSEPLMESTDSGGGGGSGLSFDLNGYSRGDIFVGKKAGSSAAAVKASYGEFALKLNASSGSVGNAYVETRLRYGLQQGQPSPELITKLREAYVNAYLGPLDLRVGQQIIVWGKADAFNPTNNLTPFDLSVRSPIEDDRRIGNVAARGFLNFQPFKLEMVWVPMYAHTKLPNLGIPYVNLVDTFPESRVENSTGAARMHLELESIEMSASYLTGYAPMAGLTFNRLVWGQDAEIRINRVPYKHQVIGADFSTAIGEIMTVRGEAAYRKPRHSDRVNAPQPDLQYTLGIDKSFGSLSVVAQYLGRYTFDWRKAPPPQPGGANPAILSSIPDPSDQAIADGNAQVEAELPYRNQILFQQLAQVQHIATVRLEYLALHDTLSLTAQGMVNFTTKEWLAHPKLTYQISDALQTAVGAEIFAGPDGTLLGLVDAQMSAGYTELRLTF